MMRKWRMRVFICNSVVSVARGYMHVSIVEVVYFYCFFSISCEHFD